MDNYVLEDYELSYPIRPLEYHKVSYLRQYAQLCMLPATAEKVAHLLYRRICFRPYAWVVEALAKDLLTPFYRVTFSGMTGDCQPDATQPYREVE